MLPNGKLGDCVCRAYPSHGRMFCSNPGPQKCLMFLPQSCQQSPADPGKPSVPEVAPGILLPLILCYPKMLQRVLVGPRNCPSADLEVSLP